ncbi:serine--tRNA ligase [Puniceicoccus vermicola]|uniref:Serine--tRNA ligase n=1 Tax=Puniceicoccus vermicola TaxID=388746 RepID=A0A7X1B003_9BACT|nr:serine--tRNA ligase [Puniceicoccus vermicola]MBC2603116.1 serine--tRNA ligase [Puniceicoccus vermicola]
MLDIQKLRENPEWFRGRLGRKKFSADLDEVLRLDESRRRAVTDAEAARANQNAANKEMAALKKGSEEFMAKVGEMKKLSAETKSLEASAKEADEAFKNAFMKLPNAPSDESPDGRGDADNVEIRRSAHDLDSYATAKAHFDLPGIDKLLDFERGTKVSGAGFPFYRGDLARFVRVLIGAFLDHNASRGYSEIAAPLVVNADSARATGQLPDKEGQMYSCREEELYLIPTAEVPVTNFYRNEIIGSADLPLKHSAYTPCFRREAGSWGADVRGLNRLHQFDKVEIVRWEKPEDSEAAHLELLGDAEAILQALDLPYRVLEICSGDMGFPHFRQFDLEVFAAGQKRWLEVSSCSNFTDFQARRANIRFRREEGAKPEFVHTLNGSSLAIPRVLAALLENGFDGESSVRLPEFLASRFGSDVLKLPV